MTILELIEIESDFSVVVGLLRRFRMEPEYLVIHPKTDPVGRLKDIDTVLEDMTTTSEENKPADASKFIDSMRSCILQIIKSIDTLYDNEKRTDIREVARDYLGVLCYEFERHLNSLKQAYGSVVVDKNTRLLKRIVELLEQHT
jgi:hypothetical protein